MIRLALACFVMVLLFGTGSAGATQEGLQVMKNWALMDKCAREAQQAFPDYSADAYAKRDARLRDCLAGRHLPAREPLAPAR